MTKENNLFEKRFIYYLSAFVIVSATVFGLMLFFVKVPESNQRLVEMYADVYLLVGAVMVLQFFFGSSKGSKDKDKILSKNP